MGAFLEPTAGEAAVHVSVLAANCHRGCSVCRVRCSPQIHSSHFRAFLASEPEPSLEQLDPSGINQNSLFTAEDAEDAEDYLENDEFSAVLCDPPRPLPFPRGAQPGVGARSAHRRWPCSIKEKSQPSDRSARKGTMPPHRRQRRGRLGNSDAHGAIPLDGWSCTKAVRLWHLGLTPIRSRLPERTMLCTAGRVRSGGQTG